MAAGAGPAGGHQPGQVGSVREESLSALMAEGRAAEGKDRHLQLPSLHVPQEGWCGHSHWKSGDCCR